MSLVSHILSAKNISTLLKQTNKRATRTAVAIEGQAVVVVYPCALGSRAGMDVVTDDAVTPLGRDGPKKRSINCQSRVMHSTLTGVISY